MSKASKQREELALLSSLNLSSCVPACKIEDLNPALVDAIIMAQKMAGFQFTITSAYRSQAYERSKGRKGSSSHCKGFAVDVSARDSYARYKILIAAAYSGIPRIGVGKTFLHLDIDETKPHPIIFHYYEPQET